MLGRVANDVRLASDGRDHYVLRFEVSQGDLRGAHIAVSSDGGVISAVAVQGPAFDADAAFRLEQALEMARHSLEERGIAFSEVEVRTSDGRQGGGQRDRSDDEEGLESRDNARSTEMNGLSSRENARRSAASTIDYYV